MKPAPHGGPPTRYLNLPTCSGSAEPPPTRWSDEAKSSRFGSVGRYSSPRQRSSGSSSDPVSDLELRAQRAISTIHRGRCGGEPGHFDVNAVRIPSLNPAVAMSARHASLNDRRDRVGRCSSFRTIIHPDPIGLPIVPLLDIIVPPRDTIVPIRDTIVPARALWKLLHLERAKAVPQALAGGYPGKRSPTNLVDVERHLAGEITLAFTPLVGDRALFVALDVDVQFSVLLPSIREYIAKLGSPELTEACFATDGSDEGRGKVVVCFDEPVPARYVHLLALRLLSSTRAAEAARGLESSAFSAFPQGGTGGVVRILGRNLARHGPLERAFSLDGEQGLQHVRPLSAAFLAKMVDDDREPEIEWVARLVETPWGRAEGTNRHFSHLVALAHEAVRRGGTKVGQFILEHWVSTIKANSPELSRPSSKNGDRRNVLDRGRERAWQYAVDDTTSWRPLDFSGGPKYSEDAVRFYKTLLTFAREKGLPPNLFGVDYERIATLLSKSKSTAHRHSAKAERQGIIVIHDRGLPKAKGVAGLTALFGLVGRNQTPEQVRAIGAASERVQDRMLERRGRGGAVATE